MERGAELSQGKGVMGMQSPSRGQARWPALAWRGWAHAQGLAGTNQGGSGRRTRGLQGTPGGLPAGPKARWPGWAYACCSVWLKVTDASETNPRRASSTHLGPLNRKPHPGASRSNVLLNWLIRRHYIIHFMTPMVKPLASNRCPWQPQI